MGLETPPTPCFPSTLPLINSNNISQHFSSIVLLVAFLYLSALEKFCRSAPPPPNACCYFDNFLQRLAFSSGWLTFHTCFPLSPIHVGTSHWSLRCVRKGISIEFMDVLILSQRKRRWSLWRDANPFVVMRGWAHESFTACKSECTWMCAGVCLWI